MNANTAETFCWCPACGTSNNAAIRACCWDCGAPLNSTPTTPPAVNKREAFGSDCYAVTYHSIVQNDPGAFGNSALRWRIVLSAPSIGQFSLPFEHRTQAEACRDYVRVNGKVPLIAIRLVQSQHRCGNGAKSDA